MTHDPQGLSSPDGGRSEGGSSGGGLPGGDGLAGGIALLGAVRPASATVIEHARMDLARRIAVEASGSRLDRQPGRRPSRRAILASAAAVLLTGGAVGTYVEQTRAHPAAKPGTTATSAPQVQTLEELLQQVRAQPDTWRDSPFWYARRVEPAGPGGKYGLMQNWTGHEQSYWLDNRTGTEQTNPVPTGDTRFSLAVKGDPITWDGLFDVPTDPVALAAQMWTQNQNLGLDQDSALFLATTGLLGGPLPSELRAAALQILASLDRATVVGPVADSLGRPGFAIRYTRPDEEPAIGGYDTLTIVDQATGLVNEGRDLTVDPHFSTITVVQGPVASLGATVPVPAELAAKVAALDTGRS
jgi:hypothetical protein